MIDIFKKNRYVKRKWDEEDVVYYLHFRGENAVRQMEIHSDHIVRLSEKDPVSGDSYLYDQNFSDIEWQAEDFIDKYEFDRVWNNS